VAKAAMGEAAPGIYELGGPEVATFRELMQRMLRIIRRRRLIVELPPSVARAMAGAFDFGQRASLGLIANSMLTRDQVRQLGRDNVVSPGARGFAELGIVPTPMEAVLESYLYSYRPAGQYTAIQESAIRART
jgi:NADH dehydrogenase